MHETNGRNFRVHAVATELEGVKEMVKRRLEKIFLKLACTSHTNQLSRIAFPTEGAEDLWFASI